MIKKKLKELQMKLNGHRSGFNNEREHEKSALSMHSHLVHNMTVELFDFRVMVV